MKKLLLLGGTRFVLPAIEAAHKLGVHVITCDYLPGNYAHRFSDEYHNVSVIDKEAVLELARSLQIDGILSYASDAGATTAAYVAQEMGLAGNPYESVCILQNKGRFRAFLKENGFNVPKAKAYRSVGEAVSEADTWEYPVIVKPTDSAGSKGVTRVNEASGLMEAAQFAMDTSIEGGLIIEQFIAQAGYSTDTDSFSIDSELVFCSFDDQLFDRSATNPYAPAGFMWPSSMAADNQAYLRSEIARLIRLLNVGTAIYNIETRVGQDGKPYIMELSPRAGGNRLAEMLRYATGQDLILATVQSAMGMKIEPALTEPVYHGFWGEAILHSNEDGAFDHLDIDDRIRDHVVEIDMHVEPGDHVNRFASGRDEIGTLVLKASGRDELEQILGNISRYVKVCVREDAQ